MISGFLNCLYCSCLTINTESSSAGVPLLKMPSLCFKIPSLGSLVEAKGSTSSGHVHPGRHYHPEPLATPISDPQPGRQPGGSRDDSGGGAGLVRSAPAAAAAPSGLDDPAVCEGDAGAAAAGPRPRDERGGQRVPEDHGGVRGEVRRFFYNRLYRLPDSVNHAAS